MEKRDRDFEGNWLGQPTLIAVLVERAIDFDYESNDFANRLLIDTKCEAFRHDGFP